MPDMICLQCGEPWDMDFVLHDEPESFERKGAAISSCPACVSHEKPIRSYNEMAMAAALADVMGDDVDGFVSALEDAGLT